jgi:hypothetical protein
MVCNGRDSGFCAGVTGAMLARSVGYTEGHVYCAISDSAQSDAGGILPVEGSVQVLGSVLWCVSQPSLNKIAAASIAARQTHRDSRTESTTRPGEHN